MKTLWKKFETKIAATARTLWCHRVCYAGLALAYGAGCLGVVDKDTVAQIVTGIYVTMVAQRH